MGKIGGIEMLKAGIVVASLIVVVTVAAGIGSKLASGKSEAWTGGGEDLST